MIQHGSGRGGATLQGCSAAGEAHQSLSRVMAQVFIVSLLEQAPKFNDGRRGYITHTLLSGKQ